MGDGCRRDKDRGLREGGNTMGRPGGTRQGESRLGGQRGSRPGLGSDLASLWAGPSPNGHHILRCQHPRLTAGTRTQWAQGARTRGTPAVPQSWGRRPRLCRSAAPAHPELGFGEAEPPPQPHPRISSAKASSSVEFHGGL